MLMMSMMIMMIMMIYALCLVYCCIAFEIKHVSCSKKCVAVPQRTVLPRNGTVATGSGGGGSDPMCFAAGAHHRFAAWLGWAMRY